MKSFGRLLRNLRGSTPLQTIATRTTLETGYLVHLETGRLVPDSFLARHILSHGFGLPREDVTRLVLGIELYDLGLRDNEVRQLVIDLIRKAAPATVRDQLHQLYRGYAS